MRKKLLIALAVVGALILAFAGVVAMQPSDFRVSRSAEMAAAPDKVFAHVDDFHLWDAWSPWAKLDPNAKTSFDGPSSGKGASFHWDGNNDVGEGSMTITDSRPHELVRIRLDFVRPFAGTSDVEFAFQPKGEHTDVTWTMSGKNNFLGKAFSLFIDCDAMMGPEFDKGLANLKSIVEKPAAE